MAKFETDGGRVLRGVVTCLRHEEDGRHREQFDTAGSTLVWRYFDYEKQGDFYAYYSYADGKDRYVLITARYSRTLDDPIRWSAQGEPVLQEVAKTEFRRALADRGCPLAILEDFDNNVVRDFAGTADDRRTDPEGVEYLRGVVACSRKKGGCLGSDSTRTKPR